MMQSPSPQTIHLADYRPFPFRIDTVTLTFRLAPRATRVRARLAITPLAAGADLRLDGEGLRLLTLAVDGVARDASPDATGLTLTTLPDRPFVLETEVEIAPEGNTALEGLYMSNGMYCTQCEAEGFRKITFYPDRPDVMARFMCASKATCRCCCPTATRWPVGRAGRNGTIPGPNPPICSRWWQAICARIPGAFRTSGRARCRAQHLGAPGR
jgi:hypothetical protein